VPQLAPVPPVVVAVTVNAVVVAGVAVVVLIVRVDVVALFETVVGTKPNVTPAGVPPVKASVRGIVAHVPLPVHVVVIEYVALEPAVTGFGDCVPTVVVVIVSGACTTKLLPLLVTELAPQLAPVPPVVAAVTVKGVVLAGVAVVVVIVSVEVAAAAVTVVGLNEAIAPVGAVQLIVSGAEVQVPLPAHVVVTV